MAIRRLSLWIILTVFLVLLWFPGPRLRMISTFVPVDEPDYFTRMSRLRDRAGPDESVSRLCDAERAEDYGTSAGVPHHSLIPFPFLPMKRSWTIALLLATLIIVLSVVAAATLWRVAGKPEPAPENPVKQQQLSSVPGRDESLALIDGTMQSFAQALIKKDFTDFYGTFSSVWKKQTTTAAIENAFSGFLPFGQEVQKAVSADPPRLNAPPAIGETNVLILQGFYRIEATKMLFSLQYVQEKGAWKLLGMNLEVK